MCYRVAITLKVKSLALEMNPIFFMYMLYSLKDKNHPFPEKSCHEFGFDKDEFVSVTKRAQVIF